MGAFSPCFLLLSCLVGVTPSGAFPGPGHEYMPPTSVMQRSPCPVLNTLANHGFISRDGKNASISELIQGAEDVFSVSSILTQAVIGAFKSQRGFAPKLVKNSNGEEDEIFDLVDAYDLGHDASLFRHDATESNPFPQFDKFLFDGMVVEQKGLDMGDGRNDTTTDMTWDGIANHVANRIRYSRKNNPDFYLSDVDVGSITADMFALFLFDVDPNFETVSINNMESFISLNRIPDEFIPRKELGLPLVTPDNVFQARQYFLARVTREVADSTITPAECNMGPKQRILGTSIICIGLLHLMLEFLSP